MATPQPLRLTLASGSIGRRYLLEKAGYSFAVLPSGVEEPNDAAYSTPRHLVQHIAWLKAAAVAPRVTEGWVLAADTISWIDGKPIGKPADEADARRILRTLAGREHELWTGVILWRRPDELQIAWQERSLVAFAHLSEVELERYLATRSWQGNAGAYAIEEAGDPYVRVVDGSLSNVIGLPMESLNKTLAWLAPDYMHMPDAPHSVK
jgi:septum formation protein